MTFDDLVWKPHPISATWFVAVGTLPNGVSYSVVFDPLNGYPEDPPTSRVYNVGTARDADLDNDSLEFVAPADVTAVLEKAAAL